jgi:hypothetical protein
MMWIDKSQTARGLGLSAGEMWECWSFGYKVGWCRELDKLESKYRQLTWVTISVAAGWRQAKKVRQFFHDFRSGQTHLEG